MRENKPLCIAFNTLRKPFVPGCDESSATKYMCIKHGGHDTYQLPHEAVHWQMKLSIVSCRMRRFYGGSVSVAGQDAGVGRSECVAIS